MFANATASSTTSIHSTSTATPAYVPQSRIARSFYTNPKTKHLSGTDHRVFGFIASYRGNATGIGWPSARNIAAELGLTVSQVFRSLKRLRKWGFIDRTEEQRGSGSIIYFINTGIPLQEPKANNQAIPPMSWWPIPTAADPVTEEWGGFQFRHPGVTESAPITFVGNFPIEEQQPAEPVWSDEVVVPFFEYEEPSFGDLGADNPHGVQEEKLAWIEVNPTIHNAASPALQQPPIALESTLKPEPCQTITANLNGWEMAFPLAGVQDSCRSMHQITNGSTSRFTPEPAPPPPTLPQLPDTLDDRQKRAIYKLLGPLDPVQANEIAEELAARMAAGGVEKPVGYLNGLIRNAKAGHFVPAASARAAEAKTLEKQRQQIEKIAKEKAAKALDDDERQRATMDKAMTDLESDRLAELKANFLGELKREKPFMYGIFKSFGFTGALFDGSFRQFCAKKLKSG